MRIEIVSVCVVLMELCGVLMALSTNPTAATIQALKAPQNQQSSEVLNIISLDPSETFAGSSLTKTTFRNWLKADEIATIPTDQKLRSYKLILVVLIIVIVILLLSFILCLRGHILALRGREGDEKEIRLEDLSQADESTLSK
ncbi:hypothetical protein ACOME3_005499 [Neoechinorhynchus agilis]